MADNRPKRGDSDNVLLQKIARALSTDGASGFATTAYVDAAVESIVGMAPDTLDTLGELADALNDDPDFAASITALVNEKVPLNGSDPMTGNLSTPGVQFLQSGAEKSRAYISSNIFTLEDRGSNGVRPIAKWDQTKTNGFAAWSSIGLGILDNAAFDERIRMLFHHGAPDGASGTFYVIHTPSSNTIATYNVDTDVWSFSGTVEAPDAGFSGNLTGNVTGDVSGNAGTATKLATARTINGVSFDGTGNITVTAAASTLTGTTLASGVVDSSLTSVAAGCTVGGKTIASVDTHSTLTYAATTDIDMTSTDNFRTVTLTGDITFTTSNRAAARSRTIRIIGDSSTRNLTFPAWKFVGSAAPTTLAANKVAILTLTAFGTNDTDIVAAYAVEP